jgi:hypothetical protein
MDQGATNRTNEPEDCGGRISQFTERTWGYRLIRGAYHIQRNGDLEPSPIENKVEKDFEEYG